MYLPAKIVYELQNKNVYFVIILKNSRLMFSLMQPGIWKHFIAAMFVLLFSNCRHYDAWKEDT
jgi:hypothetical protein